MRLNGMDKALYIAMTAAKHNMLGQSVRANNLANANTTGFRADFEQARSMGVYYGEGHSTRAYALTERPAVNFANGPMIQTGRDRDIAIKGEGFIAVQGANEQEAYTRVGNLSIDNAGILRTGNGLPVMGNAGPIAVPEFQKIEIGDDGIISIVAKGSPPDALTQVDQIKLVNPGINELEKKEDGLLYAKNQEDEIFANPDIRITSGFLEGSNVNAIEELMRIMTLSRQYEMSIKVMQTAQQNSESSARLLQPSS
jgi:flagellar basal-body rod protein FlgF